MGNQQATASEIGWLAGIVDGEGHIGLSYNNQKRRILTCRFDFQIVNTDDELIDKVVSVLRKLGVNPHIRERVHKKSTWATNKIVTVPRLTNVEKVLSILFDHLTGIKKEKARLMLALLRSRLSKYPSREAYDDYEQSLVDAYRATYVGMCGASTTAREALAKARVKIQSDLMGNHERGGRRAAPAATQKNLQL